MNIEDRKESTGRITKLTGYSSNNWLMSNHEINEDSNESSFSHSSMRSIEAKFVIEKLNQIPLNPDKNAKEMLIGY